MMMMIMYGMKTLEKSGGGGCGNMKSYRQRDEN
jgi:hypothetical protein